MKFNNETLRAAVKEWLNDENQVEDKYGHISKWDVSKVTSMASVFRGVRGAAFSMFRGAPGAWLPCFEVSEVRHFPCAEVC